MIEMLNYFYIFEIVLLVLIFDSSKPFATGIEYFGITTWHVPDNDILPSKSLRGTQPYREINTGDWSLQL